MNRVNKWSRRLSDSRYSLPLVGMASFLETIIVPIPVELVLIPYMLANRKRVWLIATITTLGCLLGALVGYGFGALLFNSVGQWLIDVFSYQQPYQAFSNQFDRHGFWAIVAIGVTPVPFQVALLVVLFGRRALSLWQNHAGTVGLGLLGLILAIVLGTQLMSQ